MISGQSPDGESTTPLNIHVQATPYFSQQAVSTTFTPTSVELAYDMPTQPVATEPMTRLPLKPTEGI